jgi:hypothetical protein
MSGILRSENIGHIYLIEDEQGRFKIGRSAWPEQRIREIGWKLRITPITHHIFFSNRVIDREAELHHKFAAKHVGREWFTLSPEDVEYIKGLAT